MGLILVLGRNGQVARELKKLGSPHDDQFVFKGRDALDLAGPVDFEALLSDPEIVGVINAAAYTAVDKAESETEAAFRLNRDVPLGLARAAAARDLPFVHFSTDYVFAGDKVEPYVETDPRAPASVYGRSKAEGEEAVEAAGGRYAILRTSWVYSAFGANFVKTMMRLAEDRDEVGVVADQLGRPTWAEDCALASLAALEALRRDPALSGVYHVSGAGDATWAEFAEAVFEEQARRGRPSARVRRITTADYPTPARRPANSRLDFSKAQQVLAWRARPWRDSLAACLDEIEKTETR
jgi:dTDP-4-dehydrorhamnose reductase